MTAADCHVLRVPRESLSDDEVLILEWKYPSGEAVRAGAILVELETSKAAVEIEAPADGFVFYERRPGDKIPVGGLLGVVSPDRNYQLNQFDDSVGAATGQTHGTCGPRFSAGALKLVETHHLNRSALATEGMVTRQDVECYLAERVKGGQPSDVDSKTWARFPNSQRVVILGGRGHAAMCIDILRQMKTFEIAGIAASDFDPGEQVMGVPVIGKDTELQRFWDEGYRFFVNGVGAVNSHPARWDVYCRLKRQGFFVPNLIHPSAAIEPSVVMGEGNQITAQAAVGSYARLGHNCIVNCGSVVSHDCVLEDNVHIAPGATLAGTVKVGRNTLIGMGATVYFKLQIGRNVIIHNGCHITRDVPDNTIVKGDYK